MIATGSLVGSARHRIRVFICQSLVRAQSTSSSTSSEITDIQEHQDAELTSDDSVDEAHLAEIRDISRMRPWHRSLANGQPPPIDTFKWQKERWALKERYAIYGRASGVDPGVQWPTREELEEIRQEDDEIHPKLLPTMQEMQQIQAQRKQDEEARYADLEKKAQQYPKLIAAYKKKLQEEQAAIDEENRLKDEKIKEIQSYFGYAIDVNDPRFAAMMAKKELEEKQVRKKAMKKEQELEQLRRIEEETKLLKQREQLQYQGAKTEDTKVKAGS